MLTYLYKRTLQMLLVIFLALTVVFFLIRLSGDPTMLYLPTDATREQISEFRKLLGFDRPLYIQYGEFINNAIRGDFGTSLTTKENALSMVIDRIPATFQLAFSSLILSLAIAIPIGILSAHKRKSAIDQVGVGLTVLGQALPNFWLGIILIYLFSVTLKWLPSGGGGSLTHLILPTITLAGYSVAVYARFTRSTMLDILRKDYIRTARASGVSNARILTKYGLKNALIPIITLVALDLGTLLGGAVITEFVFSWPGIGRLLLDSLLSRDFPVVMAGVFLIAVIYSVLNFIVDILYVYVNPQIRFK